MCESLYPWGGRFTRGDAKSPVAVVTLSEEFDFPKDLVALYGNMKTENLGVEKVIANTVSNPNIRYVIVCGTEVRGHRSGDALVKIHKNGIDSNHRVIDAKSAIPFIENLPEDAIKRFQKQVELVNLVDVTDLKQILHEINRCVNEKPESYGEPMIVELIESEKVSEVLHSDYALHSKIDADPYGLVSPMAEGS